ncbi:Sad1 / UNC family C-terminal protein [Cardiosporidium cionae]|uniref:Sad1 / UNC family C-terminal protein n=1 Tax=Cardiosporidium cionae TaxID=476202 RepID=A0ABQ7JB05_9APIC|nr:Sad1 / UNC family C-terminal protein [Cardiosporidium cionae]|eukprot:KAF8821183.1 Sad1 / UNC family C-terminal protein [Cardiosporidium cionae]
MFHQSSTSTPRHIPFKEGESDNSPFPYEDANYFTADMSPFPLMVPKMSPTLIKDSTFSTASPSPLRQRYKAHLPCFAPLMEGDITQSSDSEKPRANWMQRLSMGVFHFTRRSIPFLGGEVEDAQSAVQNSFIHPQRISRGSREHFRNSQPTKVPRTMLSELDSVKLVETNGLMNSTNEFNEEIKSELKIVVQKLSSLDKNSTEDAFQVIKEQFEKTLDLNEKRIRGMEIWAGKEIKHLQENLALLELQSQDQSQVIAQKDGQISALKLNLQQLNDSLNRTFMEKASHIERDLKNVMETAERKSSSIYTTLQDQLIHSKTQILNDVEEKLQLEKLKPVKEIEDQSDISESMRSSIYNDLRNLITTDFKRKNQSFVDELGVYESHLSAMLAEKLGSAESNLRNLIDKTLTELRQENMRMEDARRHQLEIELNDLKNQLEKIGRKNSIHEKEASIPGNSVFDYKKVTELERSIAEIHKQLFADMTGEVDWALKSLGAKILYSKTSPALNTDDWFESLLSSIASNLPSDEIYSLIKPMGKSPEVVLQPDIHPGQCFAFAGNKGNISIQLPATIQVSSITLEHVHMSINNNPASTPRHFRIYGISDPRWPEAFETDYDQVYCSYTGGCTQSNEATGIFSKMWVHLRTMWNREAEYQLMGDFTFEPEKRIQTYPVDHFLPLHRITFEFTENFGGSYTCIYRLRVHGRKMQRKQEAEVI